MHTEMRQKSKQYRMKREEDHQNELARIRALGDSYICDMDQVEIRENSDTCREGIGMDDAVVVDGDHLEISEEIEKVEADEIEANIGETPILGDDTYSTCSFRFRVPSEEWRCEWRDALGIARVDASSYIPSHKEHTFRADEAPKDVMYTQNGEVYGAISIWLSGSEIYRENVRNKIEGYKVINKDALFLPEDESENVTILRTFSIMAQVDCMIFDEIEWTRIREGSRIDSRCNVLYFSIISSRIYPVIGVNKRDKKIEMKRILRDFDAVMHDEMSLKAGDEVDIIGKENDWLHGLVNSHEEDLSNDIAEIVLAKDALRVRSRKFGGCSLHLTTDMKEKFILSYTRRKNSKLFHLACFKRVNPTSTIDSPIVINPFVIRSASTSEINDLQKKTVQNHLACYCSLYCF
ncbi:hypothetical protein PRIPAC_83416 [Pristionchus pacificus]|uniref:SH3 domain-containing protein n=1 Tax=Pristionchus pacificus TaxID=54126 RepID=A0A2A6BNY6_PRIPA|nr:hypothetical protein PRIPAC_83416 [Pristionchus pacificus]|eukprot:PDM67493.1 SH3 domain-containing protein [Pristionchus pacificus]